jgi:hypothetical protein
VYGGWPTYPNQNWNQNHIFFNKELDSKRHLLARKGILLKKVGSLLKSYASSGDAPPFIIAWC